MSRSANNRAARQSPAGDPPAPRKRGRLWLFRLISFLLVPGLALALIEAGLRIANYGFSPSLFLKTRIGSEELFVNHDDFSFRFFPKEVARFPGPIRMRAQKRPDTFRIFVLGESAAMGDPEPAFGAARYLEALLEKRYPRNKFEFINVAFTAINSHVILPIARECARHDGDLWIIYMGNNEMVGPYGAATVFGAKAPPLAAIRFGLCVQQFRLGQWFMSLGRQLRGSSRNAPSWGGMEMFAANRVPPSSPARQRVYHNFRANLEAIVGAGLDSGASVLLSTVAVNLKDCPPFASLSQTNRSAADRAAVEKLFQLGTNNQGRGEFASAIDAFEKAAAADTERADIQFRWGECLLGLKNSNAARSHFQSACDLDALPFRADQTINSSIVAVGKKLATPRLAVVDANAGLAAANREAICGEESFYEHVHLNFDGNYRLARLWAEKIEALLPQKTRASAAPDWATQQTCEQRLGSTDWSRLLVLESVGRRLQQPPLSSQSNNPERLEKLLALSKALKERRAAASISQIRLEYESTIQQAPEDFYLREAFAEFLQSTGELPAATKQWDQILELLPHDYLAWFQRGRLRSELGRFPEAEADLNQAIRLRPSLTEAWFERGNIRSRQNHWEAALADFDQARRQRPQDPMLCCARARALEKLKRRTEAIQAYQEALRLNPAFWEAHFELAGEYAFEERIAEAKAEFLETIRLRPGHSRAHFNLGVMLAKEGQLDGAKREFEETLRLEPAYQKAEDYLRQVNLLLQRQKTVQ